MYLKYDCIFSSWLKSQSENRVGDSSFPFQLAEELSWAVSQLVLHVAVTALDWSCGSQLLANWWTVCNCVGSCVCVCAHVAPRALCWFCSAVSVTHWAGFGRSPLVFLVLCLLLLFTPPKHSQIYYPSHSVFFHLFSTICRSLLFTPDFSCLVVSNQ